MKEANKIKYALSLQWVTKVVNPLVTSHDCNKSNISNPKVIQSLLISEAEAYWYQKLPLLQRSITGWVRFSNKKGPNQKLSIEKFLMCAAQTKQLIYERNSWFKWCGLVQAVIDIGSRSISMACGSNNGASRSRCHPKQRWIIIVLTEKSEWK